ncbi:isoleucine--tRNA ligase [Candidatus Woesearchaeota archaeon]|nr:isoleucine--tRNA ligase [Candidatus Woesearchaeota archaeon]
MKIGQYNPKEIEPEILGFWEENKIYSKSVKQNEGKKRFFYIDGPPYTSGKIHIGHAWGKALRDSILRFKRMTGHDVWDQPGFDMHGLPIEVSVEKKMGLKDKTDIIEKIGLDKFIEECKRFSLEQLYPMIDDFKRMSVWMKWDDPYMTIKNEYILGAWWALGKAHKNGYLYEGKKAMTWCYRCATALAKHELEYENVTDKSIFVKMPIIKNPDGSDVEDNQFLIIWTTTPWTIPFNLAVMVHPEIDYVKAKVGDETWIIAKALSGVVIQGVAEKQFEIIEEMKGKALEGTKYKHPFADTVKFHDEADEKYKKAHTVVLSEDYVDTNSGSGLVHTAPGCGPEDFAVGQNNGLPPFNTLDENGIFPDDMGEFAGLGAKRDDDKFIEALDKRGALIASTPVQHEYAHCWRCHSPVIFKATEQWFLATEKSKDDMVKENKSIAWVPDWGGEKWFDSWLNNLQDWCISRQRFWGIPLPIWKCECGKHEMMCSIEEIKEKTGSCPEDLHRPYIDNVKLKCECGKEMNRIPDVLDVWMDSGAAWWAPLGYPGSKEPWESFGKADLILEGKDQIRGWFNSLMCLSTVSTGIAPYKAVYMHGFTNDSEGRKMSKSTGNIISPYEIIDEYGSDSMRYYMIGGANPGLDLNYNFDDMKVKNRNLNILWNLHKYLIDMVANGNIDLSVKPDIELDVEEKYILSKMNSVVDRATLAFNNYQLNETPWIVEELFLELSRTYIQFVRDKVAMGTPEQKAMVARVIFSVLMTSIKLMAPITPIISEKMYKNLKEAFGESVGLVEESVHLAGWPELEEVSTDDDLESKFDILKEIIAKSLRLREELQTGVRWPLKELIVFSYKPFVLDSVNELRHLLIKHLNVKDVRAVNSFNKAVTKLQVDSEKLQSDFGGVSAKIIAKLMTESPQKIYREVMLNGKYAMDVDGKNLEIVKEHVIFEREVKEPFVEAVIDDGFVYLNRHQTEDLLAEGFARELCRRVQMMRKKAGMAKIDGVKIFIQTDDDTAEMLNKHVDYISLTVGSNGTKISVNGPANEYEINNDFKVKGREITVFLRKD